MGCMAFLERLLRPVSNNKQLMTEFESATIREIECCPVFMGFVALLRWESSFSSRTSCKYRCPISFAFIASEFSYSVHLFFVLSAFSLMHSTEHTMHRPAWISEYFVKRYFVSLRSITYHGRHDFMAVIIKSHAMAFDISTILLNLTFTFGFAPWSGIVWAGWL